jgi:hypothetical protein
MTEEEYYIYKIQLAYWIGVIAGIFGTLIVVITLKYTGAL